MTGQEQTDWPEEPKAPDPKTHVALVKLHEEVQQELDALIARQPVSGEEAAQIVHKVGYCKGMQETMDKVFDIGFQMGWNQGVGEGRVWQVQKTYQQSKESYQRAMREGWKPLAVVAAVLLSIGWAIGRASGVAL